MQQMQRLTSELRLTNANSSQMSVRLSWQCSQEIHGVSRAALATLHGPQLGEGGALAKFEFGQGQPWPILRPCRALLQCRSHELMFLTTAPRRIQRYSLSHFIHERQPHESCAC